MIFLVCKITKNIPICTPFSIFFFKYFFYTLIQSSPLTAEILAMVRTAVHSLLQIQIEPVSCLFTGILLCSCIDYLRGNRVVGEKGAKVFEVIVEIGMNA